MTGVRDLPLCFCPVPGLMLLTTTYRGFPIRECCFARLAQEAIDDRHLSADTQARLMARVIVRA